MRRRALSLPLALITLALTPALPAAATPTASTPPTPSQGISRASTPSTGLGLWCTAGLPARKGSRTFVLTAGHCATSGEKVYTRWTKGKRTVLGRVTGTSARLDIAVIETTKRPAPVRGTATVRPGQQVCQHGARSGRVCGITVTGNTRDRAGIRTVYGRVTPGRLAARGGDSGALVTDAHGRAVGIVSAISRDGQWIAWTPARTALANWGLTPITTR